MGEKISRMMTGAGSHSSVRCVPVVVVVLLVTCNLVTSVSVTSSVVTLAWHVCLLLKDGWKMKSCRRLLGVELS
jgi:hypothetical protein